MNGRDPFAALCNLASRENWCWKICCSTCGHMYFRYSFKELIAGKHPDTPAWIVRQGNHHTVNALGPIPPLGGWPIDEQRTLAKILIHADIGAVHQTCRFPDWLGYLGLAVAYTEDAEREDRTITPVIVPQLVTVVTGDTETSDFLTALQADQDRWLCWRDLEAVELGVHHLRMKT